jgi:hypothetical protein
MRICECVCACVCMCVCGGVLKPSPSPSHDASEGGTALEPPGRREEEMRT